MGRTINISHFVMEDLLPGQVPNLLKALDESS